MSRYRVLIASLWVAMVGNALGQIPPGYEPVIQVTNDMAFNRRPSINSQGQFVFAKWVNPNDNNTSEIFLYDHGVLTRLTNDYIADDFPTINDDGVIVWSRGTGAGGTFEAVRYEDGQLTRLTNDNLGDWAPWINNQGMIAWYKWFDTGCGSANAAIWFYDGVSAQPVTDGTHSDQAPCLNDLGDIVWTRYNFCNSPWTSQIMMYSDGVMSALTADQDEVQCAAINNRREVAWMGQDAPDWHHHIHLWRNGVTTLFTDWGSGLRMNNRGDIVFNRWHDASSTWQVCLYLDGQFWQITNEPFWNRSADISDSGDFAWMAGPSGYTNIKLLNRHPPGDLNCDGIVNAFDIDPFILALTDPQQYGIIQPRCDYWLADVNLDGVVNPFDIDPFIAALLR